MNAAALIENARKNQDTNDTDLARRLGISKQVLSKLRHGTMPLPDRITVELAELAGRDPAATLAAVAAAQAKTEETREVWQEIARRAAEAAPVDARTTPPEEPDPESHGSGNNPENGTLPKTKRLKSKGKPAEMYIMSTRGLWVRERVFRRRNKRLRSIFGRFSGRAIPTHGN